MRYKETKNVFMIESLRLSTLMPVYVLGSCGLGVFLIKNQAPVT